MAVLVHQGMDVGLDIDKTGSLQKPWEASPDEQVRSGYSSGCSALRCWCAIAAGAGGGSWAR
jgi:hypothetical protein